jgi:hypothetical protein
VVPRCVAAPAALNRRLREQGEAKARRARLRAEAAADHDPRRDGTSAAEAA